MRLTSLHDSYGSWHLYICRSLLGLSNFCCFTRVYEGHFMLCYKEDFLATTSFSPFSSPRPMANALRPKRVNSSTWSFIIEAKGVTTKTQAWSRFHKYFSRRGSNWKIRLLPKPVGRMPKTSRLCVTVSRHSFCSRFKPEIWWNCCKELLKAASNSSSVNCALHAEAIVDSPGKNYANLQLVVTICQLFISQLSTVIESTNQILIPGAGIMERRHQRNVYRLPCALPPHQTALGSSRSP